MTTEKQLIERAVNIITEEREIAVSSFTDTSGRITNIDDRAIVRNYDRWLKDAKTWLKKH